MKSFCFLCMAIAIAVVALAGGTVAAEEGTRREMRIAGGEGVYLIKELGTVIVKTDSGLKVEIPGDPNMRQEPYKIVDLKAGDIIAMANGKRLNTLEQLCGLYDSLAVGGPIKLGIRRGPEMRLVSFAKADPADLPQMMMMTVTEGEEGDEASEPSAGGGMALKINPSDGFTDLEPFLDLGMILARMEDNVAVAATMDNHAKVFGENTLRKYDLILTIQGQPVTTPSGLRTILDTLKEGEKVTLTADCEGEIKTISFVRPKPAKVKIVKGEQ